MNLFFNKKKENEPKAAIIKLRETREMLEKREKHLQAKIDNELLIARENATKNKNRAITALKRKRMLEAQLEKISGSLMTVEGQAMAIESANVNLETFKTMQQASEAMKAMHKDVNMDKIDQTMDDIREQTDRANEIADVISRPDALGFGDLDEDELNAELEELEQEELDKQLLSAERAPVTLPQVPAGAVRAQQQISPLHQANAHADEDDELNELRESMGMLA
ncbi:ESCRT-III subunit protein snf7 [Coemansia sp. RSA 2523]|nr:ESCRT-III subunit protein snf7 [Coemansia sp. RSA 1591]KAJ1768203.1 ESCRT-III subunit protein snf7 [Coemansia sp. RSA 1752]KAJ1775082.1 ESCRT-III subunit protein snf7 [Coemansia sp. RSA 1824]KAJ1784358.1 ESCRT-III subunit protein snf7 [Coemansia sp. RSA 2167]KAJ1795251.1 ESCRT-III subunit protein snf7 [Coemansia sp. RSA 1938]KAJ1805441.1 ESCRT-III subunit protein snf7 [Coemansia sp. RSA 2523]KAJ2123173.1 ESCRT-III subunit protein snf7 [Coemansia sp. RSA 788]KAJ2137925.1 ESCRT-III subunit 